MKAEELVLQAAGTARQIICENFVAVCEHFGDDLDHSKLQNQPAVLSDAVECVNPSLKDVETSILSFKTMSSLFSEVIKLLQLLYVIPMTTVTAEHSFSSLRRLKTFLRNSMCPERLNHVMILHVHKKFTDKLDLRKIAAEFISCNDRRQRCFGTLT